MSADRDAAQRVKQQLLVRLHNDPRLRGIGLAPVGGTSGYAVVVRVAGPVHVVALDLPTSVDGVPITVTTVGDVVALETGEPFPPDRPLDDERRGP